MVPALAAMLSAPLPAPVTPLGYRRILSPTCGVRVSPLCLGTMSLGSRGGDLYGLITKEEAFALLDEFFDAGGNYIDTSCGHQAGESEEWLGEWMKLRGNRDKMVIATKYSAPNDGFEKDGNSRGNSFKTMHMTVRDSLRRMQTDYIDIFYVHYWEWTTSVEEVMRGLHRFVMGGQILYPAVSDTPAWVIVKANDFARNNSLSPFVLYQGMFNLLRRDIEREVLPMCLDQGMGVAPWGVIGQGKFQTRATIEGRQKAGELIRGGGQSDNDILMSACLEKIGGEIGASLTAVALAWAIQKNPYLIPIVGGRKIEHLHDSINALSITLTAAQITELEAVVPFDFGFPFNFFGVDPHTSGQETNIILKGSHKILYVETPKAPQIPIE
ncbi:hypothetical protein RQP46_004203 [Phenoliferia psychrophenolica]